jgi:DNA-binding response OmpR family regulator
MKRVLVISRDWQLRALLRAQLLEEGIAVQAFEAAAEAPGRDRDGLPPALVVVDLAASDDPEAEARQLATWSASVPVWVIVGDDRAAEEARTLGRFEVVLHRPLDLGALVRRIKARLDLAARPTGLE